MYYLAGFIDGEGCFRYSGCARASVTNSYPWVLEILQSLFGGTIRKKKRYSEKHKQVYEWEISGANAENYAYTVEPYLREKRRQAQLLYRVSDFPPHSAERAEIISAITALKHYEYAREEE